MPVKILVTGDVHIGRRSGAISLDSSFGTAKYTWDNMIEMAIDKKVDALALTGDIVDADNRYFEAVGSIQAAFDKLGKNNIEVFVVAGNHDFEVLAEILDTHEYPHVHFLGRNQTWERQDFRKDGKHIVFAGWSFSSRYIHVDPLMSYDLSTESFEGPVIGMVHGDVDLPQSRYAPLSSTGFFNKGVDVWLLGHIHKRQVIQEENPLVFYPGSPHALSPKEKGNHGPVLISIESKQHIEYEFLNISPIQYDFLTVDITGWDVEQLRGDITRTMRENAELLDLEHQKILIYDVLLEGTHENIKAVEKELERADEIDQIIGECSVGIRTIDFSGVKAKVDNLEELARQRSPVGMIAELVLAIENRHENDMLSNMRRELREVHNQMNGRSTYVGICSPGEELEADDKYLDSIIRHQCNQLLSELLSQKQDV